MLENINEVNVEVGNEYNIILYYVKYWNTINITF